jgi:PBP1b-binding outer membrane lipoprotein LpoB
MKSLLMLLIVMISVLSSCSNMAESVRNRKATKTVTTLRVDMPEEILAISQDINRPEIMEVYRIGNTIYVQFPVRTIVLSR